MRELTFAIVEGPVVIYVCVCFGGEGWGGNHGVGWARPIFLEKRGGLKENFTMIGGGSLCVPDHSALPEFLILERSYFFQ